MYQYSENCSRKYRPVFIFVFALLLLSSLELFAAFACSNTPQTTIAVDEADIHPTVNYFEADPLQIEDGQHATIKWHVRNATRVEIQPGIGEVDSAGSMVVYPGHSITYFLTARNGSAETKATIGITVTAAVEKSNCSLTSCDPVSGRNQDITLQWEQLCLCTEYRLQIAKDPQFSLIIYDRNNLVPYAVTSPGMVYLAGGILQCGQTYYLRVRCLAMACGQNARSPWSSLGCITIRSGNQITAPGP
jgi:hypothetical protein